MSRGGGRSDAVDMLAKRAAAPAILSPMQWNRLIKLQGFDSGHVES